MTPVELRDLLDYGGWIMLLVYFLYNKLWPLIADKIVPAKLKKAETVLATREAELLADKKFRQEIERGQLEANRQVAKAVQELAISHTMTNERIASIMSTQSLILQRQEATFGVVTDLAGDMSRYDENYGRRTTDKKHPSEGG